MSEPDISAQQPLKLGLALSGGGVRAAAFHLGVLRRLADEHLMESVTALSTVSGGSLITAAIVSHAGMRWPTSAEFKQTIFPELRRILSTTDLFSLSAVGWRGVLEFNLQLLRHRASVLATLLERRWGVRGKLTDLPDEPTWQINTTCFETGKNWRFSKREMGDWKFGRHYDPGVPLSSAVAASAAVPYAIGALRMAVPSDGWWDTDPATRKPIRKKDPPFDVVRLWDGGAYENLGLEFFHKPGKGLARSDFLICSDASGPLGPPTQSKLAALASGRLASPRLFDIASDQIRSLRSRMLVADLTTGAVPGVLVRMGNSVREVDIKASANRPVGFYDAVQPDQEAGAAAGHPTDLKALGEQGFDRLTRHGYEAADITLTTYATKHFTRSLAWDPTTC
ncbi:NTE family protein [Bradyrhizobium diazoefficiens]